ncbi:MAG: AAA family ATPase [Clostridia bacterium]|nr:AAA family ATPase [Clostridia bacterium]
MRLIECYIENFGIYHEYSCKFGRGLNSILSENGSGKTTLTVFLAAMLWGFPETKKQSLDENDRKKYTPWQGGRYGGSLTLEAGGRSYTVERSFGAKPSDDTFVLRDTVHGNISTDYTERIGEELFGIDRDGFLRTAFLSEKNLSASNENKSISAKLSDLVGVDADIGGIDDALALLEERRKFYYKKSGRCEIGNVKASLSEKKEELDGINRRRAEAGERAKRLIELSDAKTRLEEEKKALSSRIIESTERSIRQLNRERYDELSAKLSGYESRLAELDEIFGGSIPTAKEIDEIRFSLLECERIEKEEAASPPDGTAELEEKYGALSFDILASTDRALAELTEKERSLADAESKKAKEDASKARDAGSRGKSKAVLATTIVGVLLAPVGLILGSVLSPALYAIAVIGAILLCTGITLTLFKRKNEMRAAEHSPDVTAPDTDAAAAEASELRSMLSDFCRELGERGEDIPAELAKIRADYTRYYTLRLSREGDAEGRGRRLATVKEMRARAAEFLSRFKLSGDDPLSRLSELTGEYGYTKLEAERARRECISYRETHEIADVKEEPAAPSADLKEELSRRESELSALGAEHARLTRECERDVLDAERGDELTSEIAELEDRLAEYTRNLSVIQTTALLLKEACDNMTARYIGKTRDSFLKYEKAIGGAGGTFAVDTDFTVSKSEHGAARSEESYSRGTRDLYALAIRLALIDSLYENEPPFIILDDPFLSFDDEKTEKGRKLLRELAKDRQILYFTCSKAREVK